MLCIIFQLMLTSAREINPQTWFGGIVIVIRGSLSHMTAPHMTEHILLKCPFLGSEFDISSIPCSFSETITEALSSVES